MSLEVKFIQILNGFRHVVPELDLHSLVFLMSE